MDIQIAKQYIIDYTNEYIEQLMKLITEYYSVIHKWEKIIRQKTITIDYMQEYGKFCKNKAEYKNIDLLKETLEDVCFNLGLTENMNELKKAFNFKLDNIYNNLCENDFELLSN